MRQFAAIAIGGVWLLTIGLGVAQAGPFGGDDPGCVPSTKANLKCSDGAYKAFIKAYKAVIKCHIKQADATFKGVPADDEPCENTAKSKLDIALGKLDCSGSPGVLTNVGMLETTLFATSGTTGSADQQNGSIYCDGGTAIDGSGEDAGTVNTNPTDGKVRQKCADGVWKGISKLLGAVCKCHVKEADSFFALKAFDENACEETNAGKGAHEKFTAAMAKLTCPQSCLDAGTRAMLGANFIALLESINDKFYPCPTATTTTTTVTTITTTTSTTTTTIPASCGNGLVDPGEQCDPPGSPCVPIGSPMGAFLCNESCQCTAACCGFANGGPKFLRFATITQAGNCGTLTTGGGPVNLACSGLYFGGAGETVALPAKVPDMGVYISKVASCSGTTLTLVAATKADTGSIRTCSSAQGHCVTSAVGSGNCNLTTFTCNGTGTCTGGACTTGKKGIPCAANTDCNLDCNTDIDCGVCDVGYVGAHCRTDHQCSCLFGAPLPVPNTTVSNASTCVINSDGTVNNPDDSTGGYGSVDCVTGSASTFTPLNSEIYLTGDLMTKRCSSATTGGKAGFNCTANSGCPGGTCVNDPAIEPCPVCNETTLKCNGGPNEGAPCTPGSSGSGVLGAAYPTSHDCPPPGTTAADIGALAVPITYTTQTSTATSYSTGAGSGKSNVFCTFCKDTVNGFANPPVQCSCDNGSSCGGFGPCPSASFASCEQNQNGAFAHADATMIEEDGVAAGDLRPPAGSLIGPSKPATEVGVFCIPPSYNSLVDQNAGLPGPGAVALPGNAQLLP